MFSDKEKQGIVAVLHKMPTNELFALAETITNRMVRVENTDEAINATLQYATSALDILKRRKMKKEYMFQYMHDIGHAISPVLDKIGTIKAVLEYWECKENTGHIVLTDDDMVCETVDQSTPPEEFERELFTMAQQFVSWFYPLLNNAHVSNANAEDNFGPHHFWRDCQLKISSPEYEQLVEGNSKVAQTLLSLIGESQLYFNPFDTQRGLRCQCDPHGLVLLFVGGVVHNNDSSVGIFEQKFGLVRDPSAGNKWKIKYSELRLAGKDTGVNQINGAAVSSLEYS